MRWYLSPFRREKVLYNPARIDLFILDEDADKDPPMYSYIAARRVRDSRPERLMSVLLTSAVGDVQAAIPNRVHDFVFLHAGAVARDGRGILMPASRGCGKSSLTLALLQEGFDYLSDEFGALDPITGRAFAVEKHITLDGRALGRFPELEERLEDRKLAFRLGSQRFVRPADVGAKVSGPVDVRSMVFLTDSWDGQPRLTPVSKAEAVRLLIGRSFNLHRYEDRGVVLLSRVATEAPSFRLEGGTPSERAELLADRFG
jgi:hypothetical protein